MSESNVFLYGGKGLPGIVLQLQTGDKYFMVRKIYKEKNSVKNSTRSLFRKITYQARLFKCRRLELSTIRNQN